MQESKQDEVKLEGQGHLTPELFKPILNYLYNGKFDAKSLKPDNVLEQLGEVVFFGLHDLIDRIVKYLKEDQQLPPKMWAFMLLPFAWRFDLATLKEECFQKLEINPDETLQQGDQLLSIPLEPLATLLSRDTFSSNEIDIFSAVEFWIKKFQAKNGELTREKLAPLLDVVRLQNTSSTFLLEYVDSLVVHITNEEQFRLYSDTTILQALKQRHARSDLNERGKEGKHDLATKKTLLGEEDKKWLY